MFSFEQHINGFNSIPSLDGLIDNINDFSYQSTPDPQLELIPEIKRLGKWAEFLFETTLKSNSNHELLASNIQLKNEKRIVGEIDYLIKKGNHITHLELASKFYLLDESLDTELLNQWIGPNRKDFLHLKVSKLKNHQFPIISTEAYKQTELPNPDSQALLLKTMLFLPSNFKGILPENYTKCTVGNWLTLDEFKQLNNSLFFIPDKHDWFIEPWNNTVWHSKPETLCSILEFHARQFSPMIWVKTKTEFKRCFIVWW